MYATYIAHYLVGKGVPFKRAHSIVGKLINNSIKRSALISEMTQDELSKFSDKLNKKDLVKLLDPKEAIKTIKSVRR